MLMIKLSSTLAVRQEIGLGTSAYERKKFLSHSALLTSNK